MQPSRIAKHVASLLLRMVPILIIPLLSGCLLFGKTTWYPRGERWYQIDSTTLLSAISRSESDIFTPDATEAIDDLPDSKPMQVNQADFLNIAEALNEVELHDSIYNWQASRLLFSLNCADIAFGPQQGEIDLFKESEYIRNQASRLIERKVFVLPRKGQVGWTEHEVYPVSGHQPTIELAKIKVPVEEALRIAEAHGGQAVRETAKDKCSIHLTMSASRWDNDWWITYASSSSGSNLFQIYIDEETGTTRGMSEQ